MTLQSKVLWAGVALLGAVSFAILALSQGESVNAAWLVVASVCIYLIAYRFYALFIASRAYGVDPARMTPAYRHNDGLDYVPTNRYVLFGHHFAAIAASIKSCGGATLRIPDEIRIDGHIVIAGVKVHDPVGVIKFLGTPLVLGKFTKRLRSKTKNTRDA